MWYIKYTLTLVCFLGLTTYAMETNVRKQEECSCFTYDNHYPYQIVRRIYLTQRHKPNETLAWVVSIIPKKSDQITIIESVGCMVSDQSKMRYVRAVFDFAILRLLNDGYNTVLMRPALVNLLAGIKFEYIALRDQGSVSDCWKEVCIRFASGYVPTQEAKS